MHQLQPALGRHLRANTLERFLPRQCVTLHEAAHLRLGVRMHAYQR